MDFKEATDSLFERVDHETLARALGVSVASVRQARLKSTASAHRAPPHGWKEAVMQLAVDQIEHYRMLVKQLATTSAGHDAGFRHKGDERKSKSGTIIH